MKNWPHGGNIREAAEKSKISPKDILDFSANINPLGLPIKLKKQIKENLSEILHYPDPECKLLKEEISQYLNLDYKEIIVENGSTPLIYLFTQVFAPERALIFIPTFSEYEKALRIQRSKIRFFPLKEKNNFSFELREFTKFIDGVDTLFLCNPNNPTGTILPHEELMEIARLTRKRNVLFFLDEAFIDYQEKESLKKAAGKNLFILRSFTKFFAIPGLRLGYGIGDRVLIQKLKRTRAPWSVNSLAQIAGISLLEDKQFIKRSRNFMERERLFLFNGLARIPGLKPFSSKTNFILIKIHLPHPNPGDALPQVGREKGRERIEEGAASHLQRELLKKRILIRDCSNIRGLNNSFIRVAVKSRKENQKLLQALRKEA